MTEEIELRPTPLILIDGNRKDLYKYLLLITIIVIVSMTYLTFSYRLVIFNNRISSNERVLVIYVYDDIHLFSRSNLEYFIHEAVNKSTNVDYYIILQQSNRTSLNETTLPQLPSHAYYIRHDDRCVYLGTIGWFLTNGPVNPRDYRYFIFLNSLARGPYLVVYYEYREWYYAFTKRLNNHVKLVGTRISCEPALHVPSYFWVMDREGLFILLKDGKTFACSNSQLDATYHREIPASKEILNAGFGIDSLMKKYHGMDFRPKQNRHCLGQQNSSTEDGIVLDPFEVIFIRCENRTESTDYLQSRVKVYDIWVLNSSFV